MNSEMRWIEALKQGDSVFVVQRSGLGRTLDLQRVERVTKTQVVLPYQRRFNRTTGSEIGKSLHWRSELQPVTESLMAKYKAHEARMELAHECRHLGRSDDPLTDGEVRAMLEALKTFRAGQGT